MRLAILVAASSAVFSTVTAVAAAATPPAAVAPSDGIRLGTAHPIATQVASQPGPIRLDGCFSDGRGADGLTIVHHALRIVNQGDRPVTAVRIRFVFYDAFDDVQATRTNIATTNIDPGQTIDRINVAELSDAGPPARITCSVDAVRYADGTLARTGVPASPL
ncbi:MAG: FxLYD domain-containing protein [Candidatus Elarobacter sp.]